MQMAAPTGKSLEKPYDVIHVCVCMHMHACMGHPHTPLHTPPPIFTNPTLPQGGAPK